MGRQQHDARCNATGRALVPDNGGMLMRIE